MLEAPLSLALFAAAWAVMCLIAGALVTDTMLRGNEAVPGRDRATDLAGDDASV